MQATISFSFRFFFFILSCQIPDFCLFAERFFQATRCWGEFVGWVTDTLARLADVRQRAVIQGDAAICAPGLCPCT